MCAAAAPAAMARHGACHTGFAVNCIGSSDQRSHTEYCFRVRHISGCEWTVQRRYLDLEEFHGRLLAVFGSERLPAFPPRTYSAVGVIGQFFGKPTGSRPEIVAQRRVAFQKYFDQLCDNEEVTRTACFQEALAVVPPEPVSKLRVSGWCSAAEGSGGLAALLEIQPAGQAATETGAMAEARRAGMAEAYHVVASLVFIDKSSGAEELGPVVDLKVPVSTSATKARVEGLKPSADVELTVCSVNAVGRSPPVSIRLRVPDTAPQSPSLSSVRRSISESSEVSLREKLMEQFRLQRHDSGDVDQMPTGTFTEASGSQFLPSPTRTPEPSPPASPRFSIEDQELRQRQQELDRQWEELRRARGEAARASEEAERLVAETKAQKEDLERRAQELLEREKQEQARLAELENSKGEQHAARERLRQEREELQRLRQRQQASTTSEEALAARASALEEQQAEVERQRKEATRVGEDADRINTLAALREEQAALERQRRELEKERKLEEESRKKRAEELFSREEDFERRILDYHQKENNLLEERKEVERSKRNLATVQAHVMAMIDRANNGGELTNVSLNSFGPGDENEAEITLTADGPLESESPNTGNADGVYEEDWTLGFAPGPSPAVDSPPVCS